MWRGWTFTLVVVLNLVLTVGLTGIIIVGIIQDIIFFDVSSLEKICSTDFYQKNTFLTQGKIFIIFFHLFLCMTDLILCLTLLCLDPQWNGCQDSKKTSTRAWKWKVKHQIWFAFQFFILLCISLKLLTAFIANAWGGWGRYECSFVLWKTFLCCLLLLQRKCSHKTNEIQDRATSLKLMYKSGANPTVTTNMTVERIKT